MTSSSGMVDWDLAVRLGSKVAGEGPTVDRGQAAAAVAELRADANRSTGLVRDFTGLVAADAGVHDGAPVLVVDRPGWIQANAEAFATLLEPIVDKLSGDKQPNAVARAVGSRITGVEVGTLLGFLASKVLGQFDPFAEPHGRLLLVAPNVVHVERELGVDPTDFRLWVCLHEETHRVQFTAVPWMTDHLRSEMDAIVGSVQTDPGELARDLFSKIGDLVSGKSEGSLLDLFGEIRAFADTMEPNSVLGDTLTRVREAVQNRGSGGEGGGSLMELLSSPEQKAFLDRMTGVMSLLEGHADVVMDGVGPSVIPSVEKIRKAFDRRRQGIGVLDRLLRRLLGLDAKMAQYRDGAKFVRAVVDKVGMEQFNTIWERPEHLPSKAEIHDPQAWMTRVL